MVDHDRELGHRARELLHQRQLRMIAPDVERQTEGCKPLGAHDEGWVGQWPGRWRHEIGAHVRRLVPGGSVADAAEARACDGNMILEQRRRAIAEREIDHADDAGARARLAMTAAGAGRRDAGYILRLAQRLLFLGAARAIHLRALHEDRAADVVAAAGVAQQVGQDIDLVGVRPEMVMRVDDRQARIEDRLDGLLQPVFAHDDLHRGGEERIFHGADVGRFPALGIDADL